MSAPARVQATPERPWLGLARFTETERDYFYGRDREIAELRDRVLRAPLTVLYGVSGYGKSSLLGAGLLPALRDEGLLPIALPRFVFDDPTRPPGLQALEVIRAALPPLADPQPTAHASLWEFFHDRALPWWQAEHEAHVQPVLIFDQFEDFFTQGEDKGGACAAAAREFLGALADLVENRPPAALRERLKTDRTLVRTYDFQGRPAKVVVTLREDFLARLERWRRVMPSVVENRLELRLLSGPQALRAVLEPARKRPEKPPIVAPDTAAAIVRFVAGVHGDVPLEEIDNVPPLLSLICEQLNERRFSDPQAAAPTRDDIPHEWVQRTAAASTPEARGSQTAAEEVLERFYTGGFAEHPASVRQFVEDELVSESGFRETVSLDGAIAALRIAAVPEPNATLHRLVDQRLLVIEERGGVARVELTHDILATLALRSRRERERLEAEARAAAQRRELRRARMATAGFLVIALLALGAAVYAIVARRQADAERESANLARERAVSAEAAKDEQFRQATAARRLAEESGLKAEESRKQAEESRRLAEDSLLRVKRREFDELAGKQRYAEARAALAQAASFGPLPEREWLEMALPPPALRLLARARPPHAQPLVLLRAAPQGRFVAMLTVTGELRVLDEETHQLQSWTGGNADGTLRWAAPSASPAPPEARVQAFAFRPGTADELALVTAAGKLRILQLAAGRQRLEQPLRAAEEKAEPAAKPEAAGEASATPDQKTATTTQAPGPKTPDLPVTALAFAADGEILYAAAGRTIYRWQGDKYEPATALRLQNTSLGDDAEPVHALAVAGSKLGLATATRYISVNRSTGETFAMRPGPPVPRRPLVATYPEISFAAESVDAPPSLNFYAVDDLPVPANLTLPAEARAIALHPGGETQVAGLADGTLICRPASGSVQIFRAHKTSVIAADFRADGRILYTASADGELGFWQTEPELEPALDALGKYDVTAGFVPSGGIRLIADFGWAELRPDASVEAHPLAFRTWIDQVLSADGRLVAGYRLRNAAGETGGWLRVQELESGKVLGEWPADEASLKRAVFSADRRWLAYVRTSGAVEVKSLAGDGAGFRLERTTRRLRMALAFSPDGQTLAVGCDQFHAELWRFQEPKSAPDTSVVFHQGASSLVYSADGGQLIFGGRDGSLLVWEVASRQLRMIQTGESKPITSLAIVGENYVACAHDNGLIALWDIRRGERLAVLRQSGEILRALQFHAASGTLAASAQNAPVRLWRRPLRLAPLEDSLSAAGLGHSRYDLLPSPPQDALPAALPPFDPVDAAVWRELGILEFQGLPASESASSAQTLLQRRLEPLRRLAEAHPKLPVWDQFQLRPLLALAARPAALTAGERAGLHAFLNVRRTDGMRRWRGLVEWLVGEQGLLAGGDEAELATREAFFLMSAASKEARRLPAGAPELGPLKERMQRALAAFYRSGFPPQDWDRNLLAGLFSDREREAVNAQSGGALAIGTQALDRVRRGTKDDEWQAGAAMAEQALAKDPRLSQGLIARAEALGKQGRHEESVQAYRHALANVREWAASDFSWGRIQLAGALLRQSRTPERIKEFETLCLEALALAPDDYYANANYYAAQMAKDLGLPRHAAYLFETAANNYTDATQIMNARLGRAQMLAASGELTPAQEAVRQALEKSTLTASQLREEGRKKWSAGKGWYDYMLGVGYLDAALALDPRDVEALKLREHLYYQRWELAKAIADCDRALQINPKDGYAMFFLGTNYANQGRVREALELYDRGLALETEEKVPAWVMENRADLRRRAGRYSEAIADYTVAAAKAEAELAKAPDDKARTDLRTGLHNYERQRAVVKDLAGQTQEAEADLRRLTQVASAPSRAWFTLAQIFGRREEPEKLQEALDNAVRAAGWYTDEALSRAALGQFDQAWPLLINDLVNRELDANRMHVPERWIDFARLYAQKARLHRAVEGQKPVPAARHREAALFFLARAVAIGWGDGEALEHDWFLSPLREEPLFQLLIRACQRDAAQPMRHYELGIFFAQLAALAPSFEYDFEGAPVPFTTFIFPDTNEPFDPAKQRRPSPIADAQRTAMRDQCRLFGVRALGSAFRLGLGDIGLVAAEKRLDPLREDDKWQERLRSGFDYTGGTADALLTGRLNGRDYVAALIAFSRGPRQGWDLMQDRLGRPWWSPAEQQTAFRQEARLSLQKLPADFDPSGGGIVTAPENLESATDPHHLDRMLALFSVAAERPGKENPALGMELLFRLFAGQNMRALGAAGRLSSAASKTGETASAATELATWIAYARLRPDRRKDPARTAAAIWPEAAEKGVFDQAAPGWFDLLASTLMTLGRREEAVKLIDRGLTHQPGQPTLLRWKGRFLHEDGRLDEAIALFDQALAGAGDDAARRGDLLAEAGWLLLTADRREDAAQRFQQVLAEPASRPPTQRLARLATGAATEADRDFYLDESVGEPSVFSLLGLARYHAARAAKSAPGSIEHARAAWQALYWLGRMAMDGWCDDGAARRDPLLRPLLTAMEMPAATPDPLRKFFLSQPAAQFLAAAGQPYGAGRQGALMRGFARLWQAAAGLGIEPGYRLEAALGATIWDALPTPGPDGVAAEEDEFLRYLRVSAEPALKIETRRLQYPAEDFTVLLVHGGLGDQTVQGQVEWLDGRADENLGDLVRVEDKKQLTWVSLPLWLSDDGLVEWSAASGELDDRRLATHLYLKAGLKVNGAAWSLLWAIPRTFEGPAELLAVIENDRLWQRHGAARRLAEAWREAREKRHEPAKKEAAAARTAFDAGRPQEAIVAYDRALALCSAEEDWLYHRTLAASQLPPDAAEARTAAAVLVETALRNRPWRERTVRLAGWSFFNLGKHAEALAAWQSAERLVLASEKKPDGDLLIGLALGFASTGDTAQAIASYRRACELEASFKTRESVEKLSWPKAEKDALEALRQTAEKSAAP